MGATSPFEPAARQAAEPNPGRKVCFDGSVTGVDPPTRWRSLTYELDQPGSPARTAVDRLLANAAGVRDLQRDYRDAIGDLLVGSRGGNAGTIGTAFDLMLRYMVDPSPDLRMAAHGAHKLGESGFRALLEIVAGTGGSVSGPVSTAGVAADPVYIPIPELTIELGELARACWAMALLVEVYRRGGIAPGSPLESLGSFMPITPDQLLALATTDDVVELVELAALARVNLLPELATCPTPWYSNFGAIATTGRGACFTREPKRPPVQRW